MDKQIQKAGSVSSIGLYYFLAFIIFLPVLFFPDQCFSQSLSGTVGTMINGTYTGIPNIQVNAYIAPRTPEGRMVWGNSDFTSSGGDYFFLAADPARDRDEPYLDHCTYYLEANAWETPYVNQYYNGTQTGAVNPSLATEINVCRGIAVNVNFTLRNGGAVEGNIFDGVTPVQGMRVRATAVLYYDAPIQVTTYNQNTGKDVIIDTTEEREEYIYLRDTYSQEVRTTVLNGAITTMCNFRDGAALGSYLLQGIVEPKTNSGTAANRSELLLEIGGEESRCGIPFSYQGYQEQTLTFAIPMENDTPVSNDFYLQDGYVVVANIASPGVSLCNATVGLYRWASINLTTINVHDDGSIEIVPYTREFFKLEAVKGMNPVYPDYYTRTNPLLICDEVAAPRYTSNTTFANLQEGEYRVEYFENYIRRVDQISSSVSVGPSQTSANIVINSILGTTDLPAPRVFLNQNSGGCGLRVACWISGTPPTECDDDPLPMDSGVCNDLTLGNIYDAYSLDDRATHYYINFYEDAVNCSNMTSATSISLKNYSILNHDTLTPRRCECYSSTLGNYFRVGALNILNTDTDTNSSLGKCIETSDPLDLLQEYASNDKPIEYPIASIGSMDYISNTVANKPGKSLMWGLELENKSKDIKPKNSGETIQLASLNWVDYLFNLLKKIAGKLSNRWTAFEDPVSFGIYSQSIGEGGDGSPDDVSGNQDSQETSAFSDLSLLRYVVSNMPDEDGDSLPDYWEDCNGLDSKDPSGSEGKNGDPDNDGLSNYWEYFYGTNPRNSSEESIDGWDSDGDGIPDGWEVEHKLKPLVNDSAGDNDGDGLTNLVEYLCGTDPNKKSDANVLYVDRNKASGGNVYDTIEDALDAAVSGSVVKVAGGYFDDPQIYTFGDNSLLSNGNLVVGEGVRLIGDRAATTVIDLEGTHQIEVEDGGSLIGFTIENPPADVPVIEVSSATVTIANNILLGPDNTGTGDTGILLSASSSGTEIHNNQIWGFTSGFSLQNSSPDIHNNIIGLCASAVLFSSENGDTSNPVIAYNYLYSNQYNPAQDNFIYSNKFNTDPSFTDPLFVNEAEENYHLQGQSPLRDAGDYDESFNDLDGSRNDIGPDGGPYGPIDQNVPFAGILSDAPADLTILPGGQIRFDGSGSTDEWGIAEYCWNFGEPGSLTCDIDEEKPVHTFNTCGNYPVTLTVTDHSNFSSVATATVRVGDPPIISLQISPNIPRVNEPVVFTGIGADEFDWIIGEDAEVAPGETIGYTFTEPGLYEVIMSVDDICKSTVRMLVTVIDENSSTPVSLEMDSQGDTLTVVGDVNNSLNGVSLKIPDGALSESILITIAENFNVPDLPLGFTGIGIPFDLGPDGLNFSRPLQLSVPYTQDDLDRAGVENPEDLRVVWYNDVDREWQEIPVAGVDRDLKLLLLEITHFSLYQAVAVDKPSVPEGLTATAASVNNVQIVLDWYYLSNSIIDGFIIERSTNQQNWVSIREIDKNVTNVYMYTDTLVSVSTLYYYRVIAFKYRVISSGEKIKSDPSDLASAKTLDKGVGAGGSGGGNSGAQVSTDDSNSDNNESASSGGGGFGCSLRSAGTTNSYDALVHVLILFLPLILFRWRALRVRIVDCRSRNGEQKDPKY